MTTSETPQVAPASNGQQETLAPLDLRSLFVAGVHFGHPSKRWNPKMEEYIFGKRSRAHIIDLSKTVEMLKTAKEFIEEIVGEGGECLMVGTKAQAQGAIQEQAERAGAMYINQRWLGGMMTNFQTIQARIERLVYLEDAFAKDAIVAQTKRESLMLAAEVERLNKFFGGIKEMEKLPQVLFIVDIEKEKIAVAEARRLNIPVVAIVDTNCDPTQVDYAIPGNDDSVRSITLIAQHIAEAIASGKMAAQKAREERLAAEAELEGQEAAARAAAQAKAAERAAQVAKEKAEAEARRAAEAPKDEEKAGAATETAEKPDGKPEAKADAKPEAKAETKPEAKAETPARAEEKPADAPAAKAESKPGPKTEVTAKATAAKQPAAEAKTPEAEPKAEPEAKPEAKAPPAEAKTPESKTETLAAEAKAKPAAKAEKKPVPKAKAAPKAKSRPAPKKAPAKPKAKAKPKPKAETKNEKAPAAEKAEAAGASESGEGDSK